MDCCGFLLLGILLIAGIIAILLSCDTLSPIHPQYLDVHAVAGKFRGQLNYTRFDQRPFYSFKGLPFALPPLGQLGRFRPPRPFPPPHANATVRECFAHGPVCLQSTGTNDMIGSEDCLTLNVYTPAGDHVAPLPVMVYIYGGAFYRGSANSALFGPDFLIDQNIVLVTLNHRIGVFGFLAVDDDPVSSDTSGNWGLKDQQLALHWVQQNIVAFGGDAGRVTLAGQSSGALAAQLHQFAPGSRGLFQRTIQMSTSFDGRTAFRPRSSQIVPELRRFVSELDASVDTTNGAALMSALRDVDAVQLWRRFPFVQFQTPVMPTVESPLATDAFVQGDPDRFALERPFDMNMPVLTGCTTNEAISQSAPEKLAAFRQRPLVDIPSLHFEGDWTSDLYRWASERIFARYFPHGGPANATMSEYVRLLSDIYQSYPADRKVRALARWNRGPTWFYQFDLDTRLNNVKRWSTGDEGRELPGAAHSDDVCYVFNCEGAHPDMYAGLEADSAERKAIGQMAGLFGRFVRGEAVGWPEVERTAGETEYMHMGEDGFVLRKSAMGEGRAFWDGIVEEFGYVEL